MAVEFLGTFDEFSDALTIYQTDLSDPDEEELLRQVDALAEQFDIEVRHQEQAAVVGEFAGLAADVLFSRPMEVALRAAEAGALLWALVRGARKAGKRLRVGEKLGALMALSSALEADDRAVDASRVWCVTIDPHIGGHLWNCCYEVWDGATTPMATLVRIALVLGDGSSKTDSFILAGGGKVCASWTSHEEAL